MLKLNNTRGDAAMGLALEGGGLPAPTITSLDVTTGSIAGGTAVVVTGTGFQDGLTATLGGVAVDNLVFNSETEIQFDTPAQASVGFADLVITNPDTQSVTETGAFSYFFQEEFDDFTLPVLGSAGALQFGQEEFDDFLLPITAQPGVLQFGQEEFDDFT